MISISFEIWRYKSPNSSQDSFHAICTLSTIFIFSILLLKTFSKSSQNHFCATMVKSRISKKQSRASGSTHPVGPESTIKDQTPSISSRNFRAVFKDHPSYNEVVKLMIKFLPSQTLFGAFDSFTKVVPLSVLFKSTFLAFQPSSNL